jgi:pimeloyl-ACP methyl ester carboxylesterase
LAKKIIPRKIQKIIVKRLFGARDWGNCPREMKETFQKVIAEPCIGAALHEIKNEVLLIWGKKDTVTPIAAGRIFNKKLKNSHLKVISDGRHGIHRTHTEKVAEFVVDFLGK